MCTKLEQAATLIYREINNMEDLREFCGDTDWTKQDERDYIEFCEIFNKLQLLRRRREGF